MYLFLSYYDCDLAFFNTSTLPKHQSVSHSSPGVFSDVGVVLCNSHFPEEKAVIIFNFPLLQNALPYPGTLPFCVASRRSKVLLALFSSVSAICLPQSWRWRETFPLASYQHLPSSVLRRNDGGPGCEPATQVNGDV